MLVIQVKLKLKDLYRNMMRILVVSYDYISIHIDIYRHLKSHSHELP